MTTERYISTEQMAQTILSTHCTGCGAYHNYLSQRDEAYLNCEIGVEPVASYRSGRNHTVHLSDTMQNSRYRIVHKLGWYVGGTVWIAKDTKYDAAVF